jgi:2-dehydropantoate 2-reductase
VRSYTIIGVGAVGGYYGARLAAAGHPVRFLARSDAAHLRRRGLFVESPAGDVRLGAPEVYDDPAAVPPSDVVAVALKTTANDQLEDLLRVLLAPDHPTTVVLLQNGLGLEELLRTVVGQRPLLGGLCFICSNKIGPGHIRHLDYGRVVLAVDEPVRGRPTTAERMAAVAAVAADLEGAGVQVTVEPDLVASRWKKLVWNIPFNGLSVVLDALPQELLADAAGRVLVEDLMREVQCGAAAVGRRIEDEFLARMVDETLEMRPYLTSMKLDYDRGQPLELEAIFANPLRAARSEGVELARVGALYGQLEVLDRRNRGLVR